ncbi:MAG: carbohydrate-binding domain-containing protein [Lachnospiraceae bacterium]|nr:carbohydrate-binding domain-containing protein [Lachnospiraceae bacterium]
MKRNKIVTIIGCIALVLSGCNSWTGNQSVDAVQNISDNVEAMMSVSQESATKLSSYSTEDVDVNLTGDYSDEAIEAAWDAEEATSIKLDSDVITVDGSGAEVEDYIVTITKKGTYVVTGSIENGQIIVDVSEDENVQLVLNGAQITCTDSSPIQVNSAKNLYLTLADGTENMVTDGRTAQSTDSEEEDDSDAPTAAIFSENDLIINGGGKLTVTGNYNDGISSKDDLQIIDGEILVTSTDDGIVGKDSVSVRSGTIEIHSGDDGLKSSNSDDTSKGNVIIDGGDINIYASGDGMKSEMVLVINDGTVIIHESEEGLESLNVVLNGGVVTVTSKDDGINVSDGSSSNSEKTSFDGKQMVSQNSAGGGPNGKAPIDPNREGKVSGNEAPGKAGGGMMNQAIEGAIVVNGGTVTVNAGGDGLDSNGHIQITGGNIIVSGSTNGGNSALDYNGTFDITGGTLLAYGNSEMSEKPSDISTQAFVSTKFETDIAASTTVEITDEEGNILHTLETMKSMNDIVISSPRILAGSTYQVNAGGTLAEAK